MRVKDVDFHTWVRYIQTSYFDEMEESISYIINEKVNMMLRLY
jgi:hypothetical protein